MVDDFWPDDICADSSEIAAPVAVLREQGDRLAERTKQVVKGEVGRISGEWWIGTNEFAYAFWLVAEVLDYRYRLFSISYSALMFPLKVRAEGQLFTDLLSRNQWRTWPQPTSQQKRMLQSYEEMRSNLMESLGGRRRERQGVFVVTEEEYPALLRTIFSSSKTRRVIDGILAQSEADG